MLYNVYTIRESVYRVRVVKMFSYKEVSVMSDWEIIKIIISFILKIIAMFKSSDDTSTEGEGDNQLDKQPKVY